MLRRRSVGAVAIYSLYACVMTACDSTGGESGGADGRGASSESGTMQDPGDDDGTGESTGSSQSEDGELGQPDGATAKALAKFLGEQAYLGAAFMAETELPRERSSSVSPHGRVRVFLNQTLLDSQAQGLGDLDGEPHLAGSVAVKLFFNDDDAQVGAALMYKHAEGKAAGSWAYYCTGPEGRCLTGEGAFDSDDPAFGLGHDVACASCHAGMVFTTIEQASRFDGGR